MFRLNSRVERRSLAGLTPDLRRFLRSRHDRHLPYALDRARVKPDTQVMTVARTRCEPVGEQDRIQPFGFLSKNGQSHSSYACIGVAVLERQVILPSSRIDCENRKTRQSHQLHIEASVRSFGYDGAGGNAANAAE